MSDSIIVSVIIPMLNEEKYIENCINSLINQTFSKCQMEWLLIDGDSNDNTVAICRKYEKDNPIRILRNPDRKTTYALNLGIKESRGKYIVRMDAHALYDKNYIKKCVYYLENTDADNVGGIAITDAKGFVGTAIAKMLSSTFGVGGSAFRVSNKSGYVDTVPFGAFRREVFERIGLFNNDLPRSEDNDINARIRESGGKIWLSNEIRFTYYCRDNVRNILSMGLKNGNALFHTLRMNKKAMSLRHFIPFLFFLSVLILPILSILCSIFECFLITEWAIYLMLDFYFAFIKNGRYGVVLIWLFPLFHFVYGLGSFIGLLGIKTY